VLFYEDISLNVVSNEQDNLNKYYLIFNSIDYSRYSSKLLITNKIRIINIVKL